MDVEKPERRWSCQTPRVPVYTTLVTTALLFTAETIERAFEFSLYKGWTVLIAVGTVGFVLAAMLSWLFVALLFRWRFQFDIRLLLALSVAVALPFSWRAVNMKRAREQEKAVEPIVAAGGCILTTEPTMVALATEDQDQFGCADCWETTSSEK